MLDLDVRYWQNQAMLIENAGQKLHENPFKCLCTPLEHPPLDIVDSSWPNDLFTNLFANDGTWNENGTSNETY